ncbi:MAG: VOC family protein [Acidimicrobiia bacterium]|nr:VOC family protein [Acidimicrobiia bacterium]
MNDVSPAGPSRAVHHLAIVVEDLDEGMDRYTESLGLAWANPWAGEIPILVGHDIRTPSVRFTLSRGNEPHIELIQSTDRDVWEPGSGVHHFGVWVDDVNDIVDEMRSLGFTLDAASPTGDFAYLRSPDGARIEVVDARSKPDFDRWLSGGRL